MPNDLRTEMYLSKAHFRKGDFEVSKKLTLSLLARHPQSVPLKYNLALCLYSQAARIFEIDSDARRVSQTKEGIVFLQQAVRLFNWVVKQYQPQFSYQRAVDIQVQEHNDALVAQFKDMKKISEEKICVIEDMLQIS